MTNLDEFWQGVVVARYEGALGYGGTVEALGYSFSCQVDFDSEKWTVRVHLPTASYSQHISLDSPVIPYKFIAAIGFALGRCLAIIELQK